MILGGEDENLEAWEWLVAAPDADTVWASASRQRRSIDRVAIAIQGRPWLARITSFILARRAGTEAPLPESLFVVHNLETALRETGADAEPIVVEWGQLEVRTVRRGQTVDLRVRASPANVRFFHRWREGEGELFSGWTLESGEAPVLLLACLDSRDTSTVEHAMASAASMAGVLLVEAEGEEPEE
ncbi:MAG TPA: hypothetical protein VFK02_18760 [Kofleriaceae bacterium]|nr:hypothetical protein [Kofleriaceae bacterium]